MDIATFLECVKMLPDGKSVLIMGDHGIGKSQLVRKVARLIRKKKKWDDKKFPVIDRRLSQMSEGDMIGLPFKLGNEERIRTRFAPMDWFIQACEEACLLFLDEGNRASGEVIQAAFQIGLDHELNGNVMHPESRVFMAVNDDASKYQVTDFDPAFLDRWWVCKLTPTFEEWLEWAQSTDPEEGGFVHEDIIKFLLLNKEQLDPASNVENMEKTTSRRSWDHFSRSYIENRMFEWNMNDQTQLNLLLQFAAGFLGQTTAAAFTAYLRTVERYLNPEDILDTYDEVEDRVIRLSVTETAALNNRLVEWLRKNTLTQPQAASLGRFFGQIPGELAVTLWMDIAKHPQETTTNIKIMHRHISGAILSGVAKVRAPAATP